VAEEFIKFPRTPHLFWLGAVPPRGDKCLLGEEATALLDRPMVVEEKVDGAAIGISVARSREVRVQSRGSYLNQDGPPQFRALWPWLADREERVRNGLGQELILFGEWCYARHTVAYDTLPDWFLAYDVYDRGAGRFWSRGRRDELAETLGIWTVPLLATGRFDQRELEGLFGRSRLGSDAMEGLYLRWDGGPWLIARAKLVRASWLPMDEEHWSRRPLVRNRRVVDLTEPATPAHHP
jgi:hypothetical protein